MKKVITTSTRKAAYAICVMLVMAMSIVLMGEKKVEAKSGFVRVSTQKEL